MAVGAFVQGAGFTGTSVSIGAATLLSTVTIGNVIEVYAGTLGDPSTTISSVTDNKGNTYTRKVTGMTTSGGGAQFNSADVWMADVATGGTGVIVTVHYSGSTNVAGIAIEISGTTVSNFDVTANQQGFSAASTFTSSTATTTSAIEYLTGLIYAGTIAGVAITPASGWTQRFNFQDTVTFSIQFYVIDRNVTSTGTYQASGTNTGNVRYLDCMTTFVVGGGPPPPPTGSNQIQQINFFN